MQDLTAIRLLAEATKDLTDLSCMMAVEGRGIELASLLLVVGDKLREAQSIQGKNSLSPKNNTMYELVLEESLNLLEMARGEQCWNFVPVIHEKRQALLCQIELLHLFGLSSVISWGNKKDLAPLFRASQV